MLPLVTADTIFITWDKRHCPFCDSITGQNSSFTHSVTCETTTEGCIRRSAASRPGELIFSHYWARMRHYVEYCVEVWAPQYMGVVHGHTEERLAKGTRWLITAASLLWGKDWESWDTLRDEKRKLRGHLYKIYKYLKGACKKKTEQGSFGGA